MIKQHRVAMEAILLNASNWIIKRKWSNKVTYYGSPIDLYRFTCSTECGRRKPFCTLCVSLLFIHNLGVPVSIQQEARLMKSETSGQMNDLIMGLKLHLSYSYDLPSTLWLALHLKMLSNMFLWNSILPNAIRMSQIAGYSVILLLLLKHLNLICRFQLKSCWKLTLLYGQRYCPQDCGLNFYASKLSKYKTVRYSLNF